MQARKKKRKSTNDSRERKDNENAFINTLFCKKYRQQENTRDCAGSNRENCAVPAILLSLSLSLSQTLFVVPLINSSGSSRYIFTARDLGARDN
jgi:hypothetical protein